MSTSPYTIKDLRRLKNIKQEIKEMEMKKKMRVGEKIGTMSKFNTKT